MKKIISYISSPKKVLMYLINVGWFSFLTDKAFLKLKYRLKTGKKLDLVNPKTYNEKIQWLKIYDRKDIYTTMVDKYEAKKYVANVIGNEYIIDTIGVYDSFDEIDFDKLPNQFVIKCTHDSGGMEIVKDKSKLDVKKLKKKINKYLKRDYFKLTREWPYKNVKRRIIIEKYMIDKGFDELKDYKFFCFNGMPQLIYVSEGLSNHATASISFYDMDFKLTDCKRKDYKQLSYMPEKPKTFEKMKEFSKILSKDIPHLRVDWYEINGKLYFGELTFHTCSGFLPFAEEKWNKKLGDFIDLSIASNQKN